MFFAKILALALIAPPFVFSFNNGFIHDRKLSVHVKKSNNAENSGLKRRCGLNSRSRRKLLNSSNDSQSSTKGIDSLQNTLQQQTFSRIITPSVGISILAYLSFSPITRSLTTAIHDAFDGANTGYGYETLNLILTDNSNQFIQNAHNLLALIFTFLTGNTLFFMYRQQETLYNALFEEISALMSLLEQSALLSEGRGVYKTLLDSISKYIEDDLKLVTDYKSIQGQDKTSIFSYLLEEMDLPREDLPALLISRRPQDDPLEVMLYTTSVGEPSPIYGTVKELRQARAKRLGALQRKMPEVNMYLLYILGFFVWISFPIVATGAQTVGGEALLDVFRTELSFGIFAMCCLLGIINELKRPEIASAYNVDYSLLWTLVDGIEKDLNERVTKCQELDIASEQIIPVNSVSNMNATKPSGKGFLWKLKHRYRKRRARRRNKN
jgi:hypothetical protein